MGHLTLFGPIFCSITRENETSRAIGGFVESEIPKELRLIDTEIDTYID
jgi:hypothetical protein